MNNFTIALGKLLIQLATFVFVVCMSFLLLVYLAYITGFGIDSDNLPDVIDTVKQVGKAAILCLFIIIFCKYVKPKQPSKDGERQDV